MSGQSKEFIQTHYSGIKVTEGLLFNGDMYLAFDFGHKRSRGIVFSEREQVLHMRKKLDEILRMKDEQLSGKIDSTQYLRLNEVADKLGFRLVQK